MERLFCDLKNGLHIVRFEWFKHLLGLLFCLLIGTQSLQAKATPPIEVAISNLELEQATILSFKLPEEKLRWYYQTKILFVRYLIDESPQLFSSFLDHSKRGIRALQAMPDGDPQRDVICAEIFFLRGALKALEKKTVSSAVDIKSACTLIYRNSQRYPDNVEQQKLLGIFNIAISSIPRKLKWLGNVLCFNGNLQLGVRQLQNAASESQLFPDEASLMLFYFEKNLLERPVSAVNRAKALCAKQPESIVYHYLLLSAYLENRQIDQAIALVNTKEAALLANPAAETLPVWFYSRAKAHFYRLEYKACIRQCDKFLNSYHGKTLYADALYKKGMALILDDRYEASKPIFQQLTKVENSSFDVDEYARSQAAVYLVQAPSSIEKKLYEARNLFDGGYYDRSLAILNALDIGSLNENELCERNYRFARNWQELDSIPLARTHFQSCSLSKPGKSLWMKVYGIYYWGRLEEKEGNFDLANQLYKTALGFDKYDYQSGLEQRCKAAIHQLKGKK